MKHATLFTLAVCLALPSVGCKSLLRKRQPAEESASASATAVTPPPPPVVAAPTVPPVPAAPALDVPTPEDFEDQAFEKITPQNFQAEFTRLKKEIEQP